LHEIIDAEHDFEIEEFVPVDADEIDWASDAEELRDRWRRRVKLELLSIMTDGATIEEARERLHKRYRNVDRRRRQMSKDDLLQIWLSSAAAVYDPHTSYMSPSTLENFQISMRLELVGIGAELTSIDGETTVNSVLPGGAAAKDGRLRARDKIEAVAQGDEGEFVEIYDWRLDDVVQLIRGDEGTIVRLRIVHADSQEREEIKIRRAKVELKDAEARSEILETDDPATGAKYRIGWIDLPSFYMDMDAAQRGATDYKSTSKDVAAIIERFREENIDAIVMDLRGNSGGALTEAIRLTGLFIDRGPVVQIRASNGPVVSERDEESGMAWNGPLIVLTSKLSASASEIFAGAIQDYRRGLVIGDEATHGKGTVQRLVDLADRRRQPNANLGALKITVSKFYRPSGKSTQSRGVMPDIVLPSLENHLVDGEGDLDYAIEFDEIAAAPFRAADLVTDDMVRAIREKSSERRTQSEDFKKLEQEIEHYLKIKERKRIPLKREQFVSDYRRLQDATDEVTGAHEDSPAGDRPPRPKDENGDSERETNPDDPSAKESDAQGDDAAATGDAENAPSNEPKDDAAATGDSKANDIAANAGDDAEAGSNGAGEPRPVVLRNYYTDEILAITADLIRALSDKNGARRTAGK
ncbi:MAG TPA: carboxy terminal-processing peptidase, partial [Planctomycetota bacterium]|nr:carboxy terminal-processing peptidase [Planctomycetota bacterium]